MFELDERFVYSLHGAGVRNKFSWVFSEKCLGRKMYRKYFCASSRILSQVSDFLIIIFFKNMVEITNHVGDVLSNQK